MNWVGRGLAGAGPLLRLRSDPGGQAEGALRGWWGGRGPFQGRLPPWKGFGCAHQAAPGEVKATDRSFPPQAWVAVARPLGGKPRRPTSGLGATGDILALVTPSSACSAVPPDCRAPSGASRRQVCFTRKTRLVCRRPRLPPRSCLSDAGSWWPSGHTTKHLFCRPGIPTEGLRGIQTGG